MANRSSLLLWCITKVLSQRISTMCGPEYANVLTGRLLLLSEILAFNYYGLDAYTRSFFVHTPQSARTYAYDALTLRCTWGNFKKLVIVFSVKWSVQPKAGCEPNCCSLGIPL